MALVSSCEIKKQGSRNNSIPQYCITKLVLQVPRSEYYILTHFLHLDNIYNNYHFFSWEDRERLIIGKRLL
jgi:hypothetical protein